MTKPLKDRIARVLELDAKRSPGAWYSDACRTVYKGNTILSECEFEMPDIDYNSALYNAHFIAASTDMPSIIRELLTVIEKQREGLESARVMRDDYIVQGICDEALALSEQLGDLK